MNDTMSSRSEVNLLVAESKRSRRRRATRRIDRCTDRAVHLVDADNLIGDPATTDLAVIRDTFDRYREASGYRAGDHVVIATGRNGLHVLQVELAWPGASYRRRKGEDGADLELLEEVRWITDTSRYSRAVIGSGDRIFISAYQDLYGAGLDVTVVAHHRKLARPLASVAHGHISYLGSSRAGAGMN